MNKLINFKKLIIRLWIILWAILLILLIMKFCFNTWYPVTTNNPIISKFCNAMDNNKILFIIITAIFYPIGATLTFLICIKGSIKKDKVITLIMLPIFIIISVVKQYSNIIGTIMEVLSLIITPIVYNIIKKTFKKQFLNILFPIIVNVITMVWQLNIFLIRGISNILTEIPSLISLVLQLDYYIFLIITWIGVYYFMGVWGPWFFNRPVTELKAMLESELRKDKPNEELVRQLKEAIKNKEEE